MRFKNIIGMLAVVLMMPLSVMGESKVAPRVFLNPGHGGYDSNDRPNPFFCEGLGDTISYYESVSNLMTSTYLTRVLEEKGYDVCVSRVNNTSDDDLDLFEIVSLAANSGADLFLSIHSNATGIEKKVNFPLALYRGFTGEACVEFSDSIASMMMRRLGDNKATVWTHTPRQSGDWSFYKNWGYRVGLGVLRYNKLPGMLSEGSFFDYIVERCRLMSEDYCRLEGWNQSLSIDDYFGRTDFAHGVVAGLVRAKDMPSDYTGKYVLFGDDERKALNLVKVRLLNSAGKEVAVTVTDLHDNGFYMFDHVAPGHYEIEVSSLDKTSRSTIEVKGNASSYCNFDI